MNGFDLSTVKKYYIGVGQVSRVFFGSTQIWPKDYATQYLTFEALEAGTFTWTDSENNNSISYSIDGGSTWTTLTSGSSTPTINANNKVLFKASGLIASYNYGIGTFSSSGRFNAMGNIMSLVYGDNFASSTTLSNNYQFCRLFYQCANLVNASNLILPATTLTKGCYLYMFYGCSALTTAPELPATTLAEHCYGSMFQYCSSLTTAPELPATTLVNNCYYFMFFGCTALTTAPELPATTLVYSCYSFMLYGCSSLNYIKCLATDLSATNYTNTTSWVKGVSNNGTFVRAANNTSWTIGDDGIPTGWTVDPPLAHDYSKDYLTFEALEAGTFTWTDAGNNNSISYSIDDGSTWTTLASGSSTPYINANSKVLFKASGLAVSSSYGIGTFSSSGRFNAMGNIMSLVDGDNFASSTTLSNDYQFYKLFKSSSIVDASNLILPATTLSGSCYREMFDSSVLKITPKSLPATTLTENCYRSMFGNCGSLITVMSILPAMTLAPSCYRYMFVRCTSLTTAPELPATTLANYCYYSLFDGCERLTAAPELPATTLASYCYYQMFRNCNRLTSAPELPATTLADHCYYGMFQGCTRLNYIKAMFTSTPTSSSTPTSLYTGNWVNGVAATGTFVKNSAATWNVTGANGIPSGWTVQTASS